MSASPTAGAGRFAPSARALRKQLDEAGVIALEPRRRRSDSLAEAHERSPSYATLRKLAPVLEANGPLFVAFGRFLSLRLDLFTWEGCELLRHVALPDAYYRADEAEELFRRGLGRRPGPAEIRVAWDRPHPQLLGQWHKGRAGDGAKVVVRLVDPTLQPIDPPQREQLRIVLDRLVPAATVAPILLDEFAETWNRELDLARQQATLTALDSLSPAPFQVAAPRDHLSGGRVLTQRRFGTLDEPAEPVELLHRWLLSSLIHGVVPIDWLDEAGILHLEGARLGLARGPFFTLSPSERTALRDYLSRLAADDPVAAFRTLERILLPAPGDRRENLLAAMRRSISFRETEGPWAHQSLTATLVAHWRLIHRGGLHLIPAADRFFMGLVVQARTTCDAEDVDTLRAANENLRVDELLSNLRQLLRPAGSTGWWVDQGAALSRLPSQIDDWLERTSQTTESPTPSPPPPIAGRWLPIALAAAIVLLLVLTWFGSSAPSVPLDTVVAATILFGGGLALYSWAQDR